MKNILKELKKYLGILACIAIAAIYTIALVNFADNLKTLPPVVAVDTTSVLCIFFWCKETSFFRKNLGSKLEKMIALISVIALVGIIIYRWISFSDMKETPLWLAVLPAWFFVAMVIIVYRPKNKNQ